MRGNRLTWPAALVLAGCTLEPEGAERFQPLPAYREWFDRTEACSGKRGDYFRINWFVVPGAQFACSSGQCVAHWRDDHSIYIAEKFLASELVVRHEILHDLIGHPGHPDPPFGHGCNLTWTSWSGGG